MSYIKSPDVMSAGQKRNQTEEFKKPGVNYIQVIENANGVPFQLIFGPRIGEGFYLSMGSGINQLLGVKPEDFSEELFYNMIEEVKPLIEGISADLSESREKFIDGEIKSYKAEVLVKLKGGERKWIMDSSLPLIDPETEKVIGSYGILFDINEYKQNLLRLEKAKEKVEEADRLKNAFLHNLSHEIRTPLNAIVGFSSLLSDAQGGNDERHELTDIILRSSDHLLEILNDIVEISNIEAGNIRVVKNKVNVNDIMRHLDTRFGSRAEEKAISIVYMTVLSDNEADIITDEVKVHQVLGYLINNALKFTKEGKIEVGYKVNGNMLEFYVADTGIGISPDYQNHVFDRFYQAESSTTRRYEGTGLGLSISKAYIELLGGKIWFNSKQGEGSVFYFTVPIERANS
jgi:signal transduction histidine kinase